MAVSIDFDSSHLLFPAIVTALLLCLLLALIFRHHRSKASESAPEPAPQQTLKKPVDKVRLLGTLILTLIYFVSMERIGLLFPNIGLGFLLSSIPFVLLLSLLYMHDRTRKRVLVAVINAVLCPLAVWAILSVLFNISLP